MGRIYFFSLLLLLLFLPGIALANAGTPLMWAGLFHLTFFNALIGILEGGVVSWLTGYPRSRAVAAYVAANYFSMVAGVYLLSLIQNKLDNILLSHNPLLYAPRFLLVLLAVAWMLSILLEWPFCLLGLWKTRLGVRGLGRAHLIAQSISYLLLVGYYFSASNFSLYQNARILTSASTFKNPQAWIYFIRDGDVWRMRTDGSGKDRILRAGIKKESARLFVRKEGDRCDLWVIESREEKRLLLPNFTDDCASTPRSEEGDEETTWMNFGRPTDLRPVKEREWDAWSGFWSTEGIRIERAGTPGRNEEYRLALEAPWLFWYSRNGTVLPGNQLVYQLGPQIVILDMETRELAALGLGQGPVIGLEKPPPLKKTNPLLQKE